MDKSTFQPSGRLDRKLYIPLIVLAVSSLIGASVTIYFANHALLMNYVDLLSAFAAVVMIGTVVLIILAIRSVAHNVALPIERLRTGVHELSRGNFEYVISISTGDELEELAHDFNLMSAALFESRQALADAAEENAQLLHQTEMQLSRRIRELNGLRRINETLNQTLALNTTLQIIAKEASAATNTAFCAVMVYQNNALQPIAFVGTLVDPEELPRQPAIVKAEKRADAHIISTPERSEMVVPILRTDTRIGVIYLADNSPDTFSEEQLPYIQTLADQAAIAQRQAQAYESHVAERLQNITRINQLARLSNINRAFRANLPLENILEEIAFAVQETAGFHIVAVSVVTRQNLEHIAGAGLPVSQLNALKTSRPERREIIALLKGQYQIGESYFIPANAAENTTAFETLFSAPAPHLSRADGWQKGDILLTPLKQSDGSLIGLLTVSAPTDGNRPTEKTVTVLELFANQAAMFIENTRQFQALTRQATRLQLISQIHTRMSSILHPTELMGEVARLIANAFHYYAVQIYLVDEQTPNTLKLQNRAGFAATTPDETTEPTIPIDESSIIGWAAQHIQVVAANNVQLETRYQPHPQLPDTAAELAVPIHINRELIGVIDIRHNEADTFSPADGENLETLAGQLAIAIQNAHLFNEALQRERLASALGKTGLTLNATLDPKTVLNVICAEANRAFQMDGVLLWLVAENSLVVRAAIGELASEFIDASIPLNGSNDVLATVVNTQRATFVNNISAESDVHPLLKSANGAKALMVAPLITGKLTIGALVLYDAHNSQRFDLQDQISVTLLANQAAIAIENAQLIDRLNTFNEHLESQVELRTRELRAERDRVDTLYTIARELSSSLNLDRVLNEALNLINRSVSVTQGSILLIDDATGYLSYRAAIGRTQGLPKGGKLTRYKSGIGLAGKVLDTHQPIVVEDIATHPDWLPDGKPLKYHSALALPLVAGYEMVGVLMLFHTEKAYFSQDHVRFVSAAAPIIATAINNAGLYNLISEQVKRLGELLGNVRAEARKTNAIIDGTADGILLVDAEYSIQLINPVAARLLEIDTATASGQPFKRFVSGKSPKTVSETLAQRIFQHLRQPRETKNGDTPGPIRVEVGSTVILLIISTVKITLNTPPSQLIVLRDISREAELDRLKDEFVSTVSHELRTPMTSIKGYTDLLAGGKVGELSDQQQRFIGIIKNNADRLSALVNDILDISRIDTGRVRLRLEFFDIVPLIESVLTSLERQIEAKSLSVSREFAENLPQVYADANRVTQILVNLVGNAVKYTRNGDTIVVRVAKHRGFLQIDVQDSGLGIAEEDAQQVFNRFFRAERDASSLVDGTGLGLPIAKMFTELMGGKIWLESKLEKGSTFSFTLPTGQNTQTDTIAELPTKSKQTEQL